MKTISLLIAALFLFASWSSKAQVKDLDNLLVIPPSPQAAEFIKYLDYPVDLSSGLINVSVPLYTVRSGKLQLPLSLSYHASGLRPSDESGIVGLGWTLNYGGNLSRTVKGSMDEKCITLPVRQETSFDTNQDYYPGSEKNDGDDFYYLNDASRMENLDTQPDLFSYGLIDGGGRFIFDKSQGETNPFQAIILPYKPVKVVPHTIFTNVSPHFESRYFDYFEITDDKGILYRFGKSLKNGVAATESVLTILPEYTSYSNGTSSWMLTEIVSADKADTIYFEYGDVLNSTGSGTEIIKTHAEFSYDVTSFQAGAPPAFPQVYFTEDDSISVSSTQYNYKRLLKIKFKNGEVRLQYKSQLYPDNMLDKIEVYAKNNTQPQQIIQFNQSKFSSSTPNNQLNWYKLNTVEFRDKLAAKDNQYSFTYQGGSMPVQSLRGQPGETNALDLAGYYNGRNANPTLRYNLLSYPTVTTYTGSGVDWNGKLGNADRGFYADAAQFGILKKITFPTGGTVEYDYEGNSPFGGVRIYRVTHKDKSGSIAAMRTFEYPPDYAIGFKATELNIKHFKNYKGINESTNSWITVRVKCRPEIDLNLNGRPVTYTKVKETLTDGTNSLGSIEHIFDNRTLESKGYDIELNEFPRSEAGFFAQGNIADFTNWNDGDYYQQHYKYAELFEKETKTYDALGNLKQRIQKFYSHDTLATHLGLTVQAKLINTAGFRQTSAFDFNTYEIYQYGQRLDSTVTETNSSENTVDKQVAREAFLYNTQLYPIRKSHQASNGDLLVTELEYPVNYFSEQPYSTMVAKNMLNFNVREINKVNGVVTSLRENSFKDWNTGIGQVLPWLIKIQKGGATIETRFEYISYNAEGKILSGKKSNDVIVSYIYGYGNQYPIGYATNAVQTDIAFTNFEDKCCLLSSGNWTLTGSSWVTDATSPLGNSCYALGASTFLQKGGLTASREYVVGYWSKNGSYTVTGSASIITGKTENGWTYYEHTVTGVTSISIQGTGRIDLVKLFPSESLMTTYSWDPLVGITSMTDSNNTTTYFEYDALNRLKTIKDINHDIMSDFEYFFRNGN